MTDTTDTMNRINILVCDDDKEIAGAIEIYLRNEGYQVFKAYDGAEALRVAREQPLHLIIMDIMMPRMDGIQATMKIREEKNIPIIMLSAKSEDYDKIIGLNVGGASMARPDKRRPNREKGYMPQGDWLSMTSRKS